MAVTVVRGFVGSSSSSGDVKGAKSTTGTTPAPHSQAVAAISAVSTGLNEATVATIRFTKSTTAGEKIRDALKARDVSESLAERIAEKSESVEAHSELSPVTAREHFA